MFFLYLSLSLSNSLYFSFLFTLVHGRTDESESMLSLDNKNKRWPTLVQTDIEKSHKKPLFLSLSYFEDKVDYHKQSLLPQLRCALVYEGAELSSNGISEVAS